MANATGTDTVVGIGVAGATWGTIVADPTTNGSWPVTAISDSLLSVERVENPELQNSATQGKGKAGNVTVGGKITRVLHYQGDDWGLAASLGTAGAPAGTGPYTHTWTEKKSLEGIFNSLFIDRETSIWEIPSVKWNGFTISGSQGGLMMIEYDIIGDSLNVDGDITIGSLTENASALNNFACFSHCEFKINAESAGAVSSETAIDISDMSYTHDNGLSPVLHNATTTREPTRDGWAKKDFSVTIPTYANDTFVDWIEAQTSLKASFVWTATSGTYSITLNIPSCFASGNLPGVDGPGRVTQSVSFDVEKTTANPTGMTSTTPYFVVVNDLATDALA